MGGRAPVTPLIERLVITVDVGSRSVAVIEGVDGRVSWYVRESDSGCANVY